MGRQLVADRRSDQVSAVGIKPFPHQQIDLSQVNHSQVDGDLFGGVGSLWGTVIGAITLGVANKFLEPFAGAVLAKIALLVLIIVFIQRRPRGLFALKGRAAEA